MIFKELGHRRVDSAVKLEFGNQALWKLTVLFKNKVARAMNYPNYYNIMPDFIWRITLPIRRQIRQGAKHGHGDFKKTFRDSGRI